MLKLSLFASGMLFAGMMAATAQTRVKALPAAFIGQWAWDAASCAKLDDDGHVAIKPRSVDFYASGYTLQVIEAWPNGVFRATAVTTEEGEPGRSRDKIDLKLVAPDRLSIKTGASGDHAYVRCAAARS
jgi:hypothetical protein